MNKLKNLSRVIFQSARKIKNEFKLLFICLFFCSHFKLLFLFHVSRSIFLCCCCCKTVAVLHKKENEEETEKENKKKKLVSNLINFYLHFSVFTWMERHGIATTITKVIKKYIFFAHNCWNAKGINQWMDYEVPICSIKIKKKKCKNIPCFIGIFVLFFLL